MKSVISSHWIWAFVVAVATFVSSAHAGDLQLNPSLTGELNRLLKAGDTLHKSLITQNEDQIELGLRDILWQIDQARAASTFVKPHERGHLLLILDAAREQFEQTQSTYGEERRARLEEGYNQLANLARIYKLDRSYGIFFCPDDKSSWIQSGRKGQNPFRPKLMLNCGIRVVSN